MANLSPVHAVSIRAAHDLLEFLAPRLGGPLRRARQPDRRSRYQRPPARAFECARGRDRTAAPDALE